MLSRRIGLYRDYGAFPLWFLDETGSEIATTGANGLPISPGLCAALSAWAKRSDKNLDEDYDVADEEVQLRLNEEARRLATELRIELGPDFVVTCYADR